MERHEGRKVETPYPGPGEILVEVYAVGLNPVDYKTATGGNTNWSYPHILGLDVAGKVAEKMGWLRRSRFLIVLTGRIV